MQAAGQLQVSDIDQGEARGAAGAREGSAPRRDAFVDAWKRTGKRLLTGESLFMTTFTSQGPAKQRVAFAAPYPGKIVPMHLAELGGDPAVARGEVGLPLGAGDKVAAGDARRFLNNTLTPDGRFYAWCGPRFPTAARRFELIEVATGRPVYRRASGDPDGLIDAVSLASAVTVAPTLTSTPTLGALLRTLGGTTPDVALPRPYPIASNVSLSITPSSGWDTAAGFVVLPYVLQPL